MSLQEQAQLTGAEEAWQVLGGAVLGWSCDAHGTHLIGC